MTAIGTQAKVPEKHRKKVCESLVNSNQIEVAISQVGNQKTPRPGYKLKQRLSCGVDRDIFDELPNLFYHGPSSSSGTRVQRL